MGRYTLLSFVRDIDRASRSAAYHQRVAQNEQRRAYERATTAQAREQKAAAREEKARYLVERTAEANEYNNSVTEQLTLLDNILRHTLTVDDNIDFDSLLTSEDYPPFKAPMEIAQPSPAPQRKIADLHIKPLKIIERLFKSKRVEKQTHLQEHQQAEYDIEYAEATHRHGRAEEERTRKLSQLQVEYQQQREAFIRQVIEKNAEILQFKSDYRLGDKEAIEAYCTLVLDRAEYPDDFTGEHSLTYDPSTKTVSVRKQVPSASVIPVVAVYKYVKSTDSVSEKPRSKADLKKIHTAVIAQVAIRTIHELIEADQGDRINAVAFVGYLDATDPARGGKWQPVVIKLTISRQDFLQLQLDRVDPALCAAEYGAQITKTLDGTVSLEKHAAAS